MARETVRHPSTATAFDWDEGNEEKLLRRGISAAEVEALVDKLPRVLRAMHGIEPTRD